MPINLILSLFPISCHSFAYRECNRSLAGLWSPDKVELCVICVTVETNTVKNLVYTKNRSKNKKLRWRCKNELCVFCLSKLQQDIISPCLCSVSQRASGTPSFYRIFSSLQRTDVINASIPLSGELCLLVCFTSLQLMMCVSRGGWVIVVVMMEGGLVGGWKERWETVGWGVEDKARMERQERGEKMNRWKEGRERIERVWGGGNEGGGVRLMEDRWGAEWLAHDQPRKKGGERRE